MSDIILIGPPQSSYVRTARFAANEKGISHTLEPVTLGSDEHRALHPYAKVPVMRHKDVVVYETSAITRYIDAAFSGPSLIPANATAAATMEQFISTINSYVYDATIRQYAFKYIFAGEGGPDRDAVAAGVPGLERGLDVLDAAYGKSTWLAGDSLSLADMFMAPIVATIGLFPEGAAALERSPNLRRAFNAIETRPAYQAVKPPPFKP